MTFLELVNQIGLLVEKYLDEIAITGEEEDMCGSLKHSHWTNKAPIRIGEALPEGTVVTVEGKKLDKPIIWNGFAQQEKIAGWLQGPWKLGTLEVDTFTEGGKDFSVPEGHNIKVLIMPRNSDFRMNVVTRAAETDKEKMVHSRWPETEESR